MTAIPQEQAVSICEEIRRENRGKWYTVNGMWCWGCTTFTKNDPSKRCFTSQPDYRGCAQVNKRFDNQGA